MPTAQQILENLSAIAQRALPLAIAWHAVVLVGLLAWARGYRLPRRADALLRCLALCSVSAAAWVFGNAFNGSVFALLTLVMIVLSLRGATGLPASDHLLMQTSGAALMAFGWLYPHFLGPAQPAFAYAYAAPLGTLPCPTLSFLIGLELLAGAPWGKLASRVLAVTGLFYGMWGTLRLGVWLDTPLSLGACASLSSLVRSLRRADA